MKMPTKSHKFRKGEVYIRVMATYGFSSRHAIMIFEKMEYNKKLSKKKKYHEVSDGDVVNYPMFRKDGIWKFKDAIFRVVQSTDKRADLLDSLLSDIPKLKKEVRDKGRTDFSALSKKLTQCRDSYVQAGRDMRSCKKSAGVLDKVLKTCERTHEQSKAKILSSCSAIEETKRLGIEETERRIEALDETKAELLKTINGLMAFRTALVWLDDQASELASQTV